MEDLSASRWKHYETREETEKNHAYVCGREMVVQYVGILYIVAHDLLSFVFVRFFCILEDFVATEWTERKVAVVN